MIRKVADPTLGTMEVDTGGYPLDENEQLVSYFKPREGVDVHQAIARRWRPEWSGKVFVEVEDPAEPNTRILKLCFDAVDGQQEHQTALGRGFTADNTLAVTREEPPAPDTPKESGDEGVGMTETQKVLHRVDEGSDEEDK